MTLLLAERIPMVDWNPRNSRIIEVFLDPTLSSDSSAASQEVDAL